MIRRKDGLSDPLVEGIIVCRSKVIIHSGIPFD